MEKTKRQKSWIELLQRTVPWAGSFPKQEDYKVAGGALPTVEFPDPSSAFSMFREIPEDLSEYFARPMQSLDVLQVVTCKYNGKDALPFMDQTMGLYAHLVFHESHFDLIEKKVVNAATPVTGSPGFWISLVGVGPMWRSRLKNII